MALAAAFGSTIALAGGSLSQSKNTIVLDYPNPETVNATCGGAKHVGFGGFFTDSSFSAGKPLAHVTASGPKGSDVDKWSVKAHNRSSSKDAELTSYAYCFRGPKPKIVRGTDTAPGGNLEEPFVVAASCGDKTLIGGGFSINVSPQSGGQVVPVSLQRQEQSQNWEVAVINERSESVEVTAIAMCGRGSTPSKEQDAVDVKGLKRGSATAKCPGNKAVVFGGLEAEYNDFEGRAVFAAGLSRPAEDQIRATGFHNPTSNLNSQSTLKAIAYCR